MGGVGFELNVSLSEVLKPSANSSNFCVRGPSRRATASSKLQVGFRPIKEMLGVD